MLLPGDSCDVRWVCVCGEEADKCIVRAGQMSSSSVAQGKAFPPLLLIFLRQQQQQKYKKKREIETVRETISLM